MHTIVSSKLDSHPFVKRLSCFYGSGWYPLLIALIAIFAHFTGFDAPFAALSILLGCLGMIVMPDLRPALPPTLMLLFHLSVAHSPSDASLHWYYLLHDFKASYYYYKGIGLLFLIVMACIVVLSYAFHVWLRRDLFRVFTQKTKLVFWMLPIAAMLLLNGIFSKEYTPANLLFGVVTAFCWVLLPLIYYHSLPKGRDTVIYVSKTFCCTILVLIAEILLVYIKQQKYFEEWGLDDTFMQFAWGINNNVGGMLVLLMPACFLLAAKQKHGWLYYLFGLITFGAIVATLCRSAWLVGGAILVACLVAVCFVSPKRILYRVFLCVLFLCGVVCLVWKWDGITALIRDYAEKGFSDHGRFTMWKDAIDQFLRNPIFGAGFYGIDIKSFVGKYFPGFAHNTLVQLLSCSGVLGLISYLIYRARTVWLFVKKPTVERTFLGLMVLGLLGVSLLDNHMFNIYPCFFYAVALALAEHDLDRTLTHEQGKTKANGETTVESLLGE